MRTDYFPLHLGSLASGVALHKPQCPSRSSCTPMMFSPTHIVNADGRVLCYMDTTGCQWQGPCIGAVQMSRSLSCLINPLRMIVQPERRSQESNRWPSMEVKGLICCCNCCSDMHVVALTITLMNDAVGPCTCVSFHCNLGLALNITSD